MSTDRRQRQKELAAAKKQAQRRAASRRELFRRLGVALGLGAIVVAVLIITNTADEDGGLPEAYERFRAQPTACGAEAPPPPEVRSFPEPEEQGIGPGVSVTATIETSCGPITLELDPGAPRSVNSFVFLARSGFYTGTVFHEVDPIQWIIGGDPEADGTGGAGYRIPNEFPDRPLGRGDVALFNRGTADSSSIFFIVTAEDPPLSNRFNVFGRVVDGFDTIDAMGEIPRRPAPGSAARVVPEETVYIEEMSITVGG